MAGMTMAFVLPTHGQVKKIHDLQRRIDQLRPDQQKYLEHLLRSWRAFHAWDGLSLARRAYRRTVNDRP